MHADELDIDAALVRRLVASQFPQWASLAIEPARFFGTDNATFRLGEELAVRLPRRELNVEPLRKEREWLPKLAPLLPLEIPVPVADGAPGEGYPLEWSVYRWLDGKPAYEEPSPELGALAEFVATLQRLDTTGAPQGRGVPLARRDAAVRASVDALGERIDRATVTPTWEQALAAPVWSGPPVWLHGDLDASNVLVREGRLTAVIDWGTMGLGDPACEVMVAWKLFSGESREAFREALGVDEATWERGKGWALSQALMALSYYTPENHPVLVQAAWQWLDEVLASPSG